LELWARHDRTPWVAVLGVTFFEKPRIHCQIRGIHAILPQIDLPQIDLWQMKTIKKNEMAQWTWQQQ
jgi:hypothetical protein